MKRKLVLILILVISFILSSCKTTTEYIYVIRGEKDIVIDGGELFGVDDILKILDCYENHIVTYSNKITGTKYYINGQEISEEEYELKKTKYDGLPVYVENYGKNNFLLSFLGTRIYFFDSIKEAKDAYIGNLSTAGMNKNDINYRVNNIVIVNYCTYFNYDNDNTLGIKNDPVHIEKNQKLLDYFEIQNDIYKIEKISKLKKINKYNEQKVIEYFEDNGYMINYFKNGDIDAQETLDGIEYIKDGYVIRNDKKQSYLVITHYCKDEEEENSISGITIDSKTALKMYIKGEELYDIFRGYFSYVLYDGNETFIWSEDYSWIELINLIMQQ